MATLEDRLKKLKKEGQIVLERIIRRNERRRIDCASCDESHMIRDLVAIQNHHYVEPSGCSGGDYWVESELQYVCPETDIRNRLLFSSDVAWDEPRTAANDAEVQFRTQYRHLFKEIVERHEGSGFQEPGNMGKD